MKKLLFVSIAVLTISIVNAQSTGGQFNPFKVDIAVGGAIPSGSGAKGGVSFALEPKYAVMDQLSAGLRLEAALMARGFVASDGESASAKIAAAASYLATGDYYFSNNTFRPFVGAGVGIFKLASASFDDSNINGTPGTGSATKFGGMVRAGFELMHFRLGIEYNLVGNSTESETYTESGQTYTSTISSKNSYLGIKLGFFIGGGRK
jgi:outer membrane protein X